MGSSDPGVPSFTLGFGSGLFFFFSFLGGGRGSVYEGSYDFGSIFGGPDFLRLPFRTLKGRARAPLKELDVYLG